MPFLSSCLCFFRSPPPPSSFSACSSPSSRSLPPPAKPQRAWGYLLFDSVPQGCASSG